MRFCSMAGMSVALARGWLPALVRYSDNLPDDVAGRARVCIVTIRPQYRDDHGMHQHELEHVLQWYAVAGAVLLAALVAWLQALPAVAIGLALASIGAHAVLYQLVRPYRLWCEVDAYARQMRFTDRKGRRLSLADAAARLSSERHRLGLSVAEAIDALRS